jgi:hypothetical protein
MSDLNTVGERDNWTCWLCDKPVDPDSSVNSNLGPSVDNYSPPKAKKGASVERLAHRACNTMKGKIAPVVPWPDHLVAGDPSPIFEVVERLVRKGGREIVANFSDRADADAAGEWLLQRVERLAPGETFSIQVNPGGGQFMLALKA